MYAYTKTHTCLQRFLKQAIFQCSSLLRYSFLHSRPPLKTTTTTLLHSWVFMYIHRVLWDIPEAYKRIILVVLRDNCVTWWNVLKCFMVCKSAWLSSLDISRSLYLQQQLLITVSGSLFFYLHFFYRTLKVTICAESRNWGAWCIWKTIV